MSDIRITGVRAISCAPNGTNLVLSESTRIGWGSTGWYARRLRKGGGRSSTPSKPIWHPFLSGVMRLRSRIISTWIRPVKT